MVLQTDVVPSEKATPLSEERQQTEEQEPETSILSDDQQTVQPTTATTTKKNGRSSISFNEDSIVKSQIKGNITEETETMKIVIECSDDSTSTSTMKADDDIAVNTPTASCLEPEGTTPVVRRFASRRFDDLMLDQVLVESEDEQESKVGKKAPSPAEIRDNYDDVVSTKERTMDDENDVEEDATKKKPKEPPGSPAKCQVSASESAFERKPMIENTENGHRKEPSSLEVPIDEGGAMDGKKWDEGEIVGSLPSETSISTTNSQRVLTDKSDNEGREPTSSTQTEETSKNTSVGELEKNERQFKQSSPSIRTQLHTDMQNNLETYNATVKQLSSNQLPTYQHQGNRHSPNSLSPDLLDYDTTPIPHLPPLIVPQIGIGASYDAMSMQGISQPSQSNHNGYQQPFHTVSSFSSQQQLLPQSVIPIPNQVPTIPGGKRKIHLHLWENVSSLKEPQRSSFLSFRRKKGILRKSLTGSSSISEFGNSNNKGNTNSDNNDHWASRGTLLVSWYEGTTSLELQEHVHNSVVRKLGLPSTTKLLDFRVLDESSDPPEEIVLSPYIPHGSRLTVRFATTDGSGELTPPRFKRFRDYNTGPPDSPSAAPSPYPASLDLNGLGLNANQLALLGTRLNSLQVPPSEGADLKNREKKQSKPKSGRKAQSSKQQQKQKNLERKKSADMEDDDDNSNNSKDSKESSLEVASLHPEDQIQKSLRDITALLLKERTEGRQHYSPRQQEKRQVVFVLANYFVLFLSLIAISAEIQSRAPSWHAAMEQQLMNVQDCSKDKESLFQCVENGDMAGLVASVILWMSRSAATKRIFLFGFSSPSKLWTAVYESLVTCICWGFSYMFIRRGMNPDNSRDFLRRYWKDAVYGSLAGFNAAFMKQVLKNLIPQEVIEDALQERQLKILSWLPSLKPREN